MLAYVPAFRAVFCTRMSWATSYKIAVAEEGAGSLFPARWRRQPGARGLGAPPRRNARRRDRTQDGRVLLADERGARRDAVAPGRSAWRRASSPAAAGPCSPCFPRLSPRARSRRRPRPRRLARAGRGTAKAAAVRGRVGSASRRRCRRRPTASTRRYNNSGKLNPLLLVGLVGFLVFDMLTFWASFQAVGASPELALIWMAYLIGQLGNWLPVPGGIGGTELGLVGSARPLRVARPHRNRQRSCSTA